MATRTESAASDLYDEDFYVWAGRQAALLRARRFDELDLDNLIEEVADSGGALRRAVRSRVRTIIADLLKLEHAPATDPRPGWRQTVVTRRNDLQDALTPSLRRETAAALDELYRGARREAEIALRDHGEHAAADALPATCPYTFDQITTDWWP